MREMLLNVKAPVMESVNENQITIPSGTTVKIAIHTRYGAASALFFIGGFLPALRGFLLRLRIVFRVGQLVIFLREGAVVAVESGILALVGIEKGDSTEQVEKLAKKIVNLRIFPDENDKMNLSLIDTSGEMR